MKTAQIKTHEAKKPEAKTRKDYPQIPDALAVIYVAVTMLLMAYAPDVKLLAILAFLGLWFAHAYYKKTFILRPSWDMAIVLALPLFGAYSALWSDYPHATFYAGAGLTTMVCCTIIMARTVKTEAFIKGLTGGIFLVLTIALLYGHFKGSYVELFGSKNEVGFFAEAGVFISMLALFSNMKVMQKLIFAVAPLLVCAFCLATSKSASSVVSLAGAFGITLFMYMLTLLPRKFRVLALGLAILTAITLVLYASILDVNVSGPLLKSLGKDSTLTGRTYLWHEGIQNGLKRPILGYGYFGFWQQGRPEAEHYWHKFDIPGKSGFHFHNLFIQSFVDLGFVGLAYIVLLYLGSCYKSISATIRNGLNLETGFALGISFMFLIRACVEVDIFGPFGLGPLLYFSIIPRLARESGQEDEKKSTTHAVS